MAQFRDLPIRRKLFILTLASSVTAVVLAGSGFLIWDVTTFRADVREDVDAQARILSENSAAPLAFGDERAAGETLAALEVRPHVTMACLYATDLQLLATYHREPNRTACPARPPAQDTFGWSSVQTVVPVTLDRDGLGTLYIHRELSDLYERIQIAGLASLVLVLMASAAAFLIAARIQRNIAAPLLELADTAQTISTTRDYSLRAPVASRDEVGVVVASFNNMLDRIGEALAREREANRLKDEFLATLSHELRTPLNAVLGWTQVLRATQTDEEKLRRGLESIERNARSQAKLIEDLLEISRIVTGKLQLSVRPVDLASIVDAAIEIVQPAASAKQIRVASAIDTRPAMTMGDPDRLQQVVWNLLSNAVKFTPPGGQVSVHVEKADGYRLTVRDSGRGIDPAFLPHVFESFRQADATATREHGGLGLGLAIAKQLVELHGGTIRAYSDGPGTGATFEVTLPSTVAASGRAALPGMPDRNGHSDQRPLLQDMRVLIVEDDEDARALLELALQEQGASVRTAGSAAEGIALLDRETPDVVLSDIGMPGEDGYAFIRRVRARPRSRGGSVPAVAITAYASAADRQAALSAGYQAHVAKPVDMEQVATLVATLGRGVDLR
jgi:signal transduction histidine kinase/ActR/RegA family two-component response regulator